MPFEFAFLDWLYQFRNPVMNTISIFFDYAGAHGEIWIAFTLLLLLFRRTRKAGFAMAAASLAAGINRLLDGCSAVPPAPPLRREHSDHHSGQASPRALLPLRAHRFRGGGCLRALAAKPKAGRARAGAGSLYRLYPAVPLCALPHRCPRRRSAGHRFGHCGLRICKLYGESQEETTDRIRKGRCTHFVQRPFCSIIPPGAGISGSVPGPSTPAPADCPQAGRRPALPPASSA